MLKAIEAGELALDANGAGHFDSCLAAWLRQRLPRRGCAIRTPKLIEASAARS